MDWTIVIRESLVVGLALSALLTVMIVVSLLINKEMWYQDYPADVREKWGPMSARAKRQRAVFATFFFAVIILALVYDVLRLEQALGTPPTFLAVFVSVVIVFSLFNLTDAVLIDWLILMVLWPGLGELPGTEGMASYRDMRLWRKNLLKGFVLAPFVGLITAGVYVIFSFIR